VCSSDLELPLPGLITVVKEINVPRMASLKGKMRAKKIVVTTLNAAALKPDTEKIGLKGSPTQVLRSFVPQRKTGGEKVTGETSEMVSKIKKTIEELGVVR
jgi:electron transfer flavoprotein alpha/beta subunit